MSINKLKVQILESLGSLDQPQSEQVLDYIQRVVKTAEEQEDYRNFKRRAMQEIQVALNDSGSPQVA